MSVSVIRLTCGVPECKPYASRTWPGAVRAASLPLDTAIRLARWDGEEVDREEDSLENERPFSL
jgi:hypothetical protein